MPGDTQSTPTPVNKVEAPLALMETFFDNAPSGCAFLDRDFRFVLVNEALAKSHNLAVAAHVGKTVCDVAPNMWVPLEALCVRGLAGESVSDRQLESVTDEGDTMYSLASTYPVVLRDGAPGLGLILRDISRRRRAEAGLRTCSRLYAMLSQANRAVSHCGTRDELFAAVCTIAVETGHFRFAWVGVPEGRGMKMVASSGNDSNDIRDALVTLDGNDPRSHAPTGRSALNGHSFVLNDFIASSTSAPWHGVAKRVGVAASASFPLKERGAVVAVLNLYAGERNFFTEELLTTLCEITPSVSFALDAFAGQREHVDDEAALRMRDRAIQSVSQGIIIVDAVSADNPIVYASPGFERLTGYSAAEVIGKNSRFLQGPGTEHASVAHIRDALATKHECSAELLNYRKDGTSFWNHVTVSPVVDQSGETSQFVGILTDVTHRRLLEAQLRHAQKMEAVGRLAAGIAHDFNNILCVITGYSSLALTDLKPGDRLYDDLDEVNRAGERATALTRQLLTFSRQQPFERRPTDLGQLVLGMEKMLKRLLGEDVDLSLIIAQNTSCAFVDPGQVEQVLMNLAVNARDAMTHRGKLTIETRDADLDDAFATAHPGCQPGRYALCKVTDTGSGIDSATRERVFEPFFTTKEPDKGTGLGLSVVFGIVKQNEGHICVESVVGTGTSFSIYVPRTDDMASSVPFPDHTFGLLMGTETVLLVEDSEPVRRLTGAILGRHGYQVLDAANGGEALLICEQHAGPIHLLLTDVMMPRMSGKALATRLVPARPEMKVLYVSGHPDAAIVAHGVLDPESSFLRKPATPHELLRTVRALLDTAPGAG